MLSDKLYRAGAGELRIIHFFASACHRIGSSQPTCHPNRSCCSCCCCYCCCYSCCCCCCFCCYCCCCFCGFCCCCCCCCYPRCWWCCVWFGWLDVADDGENNKKIALNRKGSGLVFCILYFNSPCFNRPSKWWVGWAVFTFILTPADLVIWIIENVFSKWQAPFATVTPALETINRAYNCQNW